MTRLCPRAGPGPVAVRAATIMTTARLSQAERYMKRSQTISQLSEAPTIAMLWTDGRYVLQAAQELDAHWTPIMRDRCREHCGFRTGGYELPSRIRSRVQFVYDLKQDGRGSSVLPGPLGEMRGPRSSWVLSGDAC